MHESPVKRKQTQPGEALAERRFETNGSNTADYINIGTKSLRSVPETVDRWHVLTHWSPLNVVEVPVKPRPVNIVIEQPWRAWIGAPTSAAVAKAIMRHIAVIVERSFMFVLCGL